MAPRLWVWHLSSRFRPWGYCFIKLQILSVSPYQEHDTGKLALAHLPLPFNVQWGFILFLILFNMYGTLFTVSGAMDKMKLTQEIKELLAIVKQTMELRFSLTVFIVMERKICRLRAIFSYFWCRGKEYVCSISYSLFALSVLTWSRCMLSLYHSQAAVEHSTNL